MIRKFIYQKISKIVTKVIIKKTTELRYFYKQLFCVYHSEMSLAHDVFVAKIGESLFALPSFDTDHIQRSLILNRDFYERALLDKFAEYCRLNNKCGVFLDVGANIGNHSIFLNSLDLFQKTIAFEPAKDTFQILSKNVDINKANDKIEIKNIALGSIRKTALLEHTDKNNIGMNRIVVGQDRLHKNEGEYVEICVLDELYPDLLCDAIKIDVEGFEYEVVKGAIDLLRRSKPILWIETFEETSLNQLIDLIPFNFNIKKLDSKNFVFIPE